MPRWKYATASLIAALLCMTHLPANAAELTISGTPPATATVGQEYSFRPAVNNPSGRRVEFSYVNRPAWTPPHYSKCGCLIGTPTEPGVYANIQIQAWDGVQFAQTRPFTITVQGANTALTSQLGNANVTWSKPTQNTDGSPLTDLTGYVVRYGASAAALDSEISVGSPNSTDVEIANLTAGTWYFEVAAINSANVESQFSVLVSKAIP